MNEVCCMPTRRFWTGWTLNLMSQCGCLHNLCRTPLSKNHLQCACLNSHRKSIAWKMCVILLGSSRNGLTPPNLTLAHPIKGYLCLPVAKMRQKIPAWFLTCDLMVNLQPPSNAAHCPRPSLIVWQFTTQCSEAEPWWDRLRGGCEENDEFEGPLQKALTQLHRIVLNSSAITISLSLFHFVISVQ